jgi:hypothetical protein
VKASCLPSIVSWILRPGTAFAGREIAVFIDTAANGRFAVSQNLRQANALIAVRAVGLHKASAVLCIRDVVRESYNVAAMPKGRGVDPTVVDENCRTLLTERRAL